MVAAVEQPELTPADQTLTQPPFPSFGLKPIFRVPPSVLAWPAHFVRQEPNCKELLELLPARLSLKPIGAGAYVGWHTDGLGEER
jgi:hypothetical protein